MNELPVGFLCGQEPYCMLVGNRRALKQAKRNAERFFPVVGVLEELSWFPFQWNSQRLTFFSLADTTLALLEHKIPFFFEGAHHLFYDQLEGVIPLNQSCCSTDPPLKLSFTKPQNPCLLNLHKKSMQTKKCPLLRAASKQQQEESKSDKTCEEGARPKTCNGTG